MSPDLALYPHRIPCAPSPSAPKDFDSSEVKLSVRLRAAGVYTHTSPISQFLGLAWVLPGVDAEWVLQVMPCIRAPCASLSTLAPPLP